MRAFKRRAARRPRMCPTGNTIVKWKTGRIKMAATIENCSPSSFHHQRRRPTQALWRRGARRSPSGSCDVTLDGLGACSSRCWSPPCCTTRPSTTGRLVVSVQRQGRMTRQPRRTPRVSAPPDQVKPEHDQQRADRWINPSGGVRRTKRRAKNIDHARAQFSELDE
jgi:hypothetical protein